MKYLHILLIILLFFASVALLLFGLFSFVNITNGVVTSSGKVRKYLLYVPDSYQDGIPTPLVISLHGFASWPAQQKNITKFNALADEHGFIVVYPSGRDFPLRWQTGYYGKEDPLIDVIFIGDLIDKLSDEYAIDSGRIYVNGFSNGGGLTYLLACTMADRIAAFGTVAGAYALSTQDCKPSRAVPIITFHGTDDKIVPFAGGAVSPPGYVLPNIVDWVHLWASNNDCNLQPFDMIKNSEIEGIKFTSCSDDTEVHFYSILGGGHSWPGGKPLPSFIVGYTTNKIDASALMWDFFKQYELEK